MTHEYLSVLNTMIWNLWDMSFHNFVTFQVEVVVVVEDGELLSER